MPRIAYVNGRYLRYPNATLSIDDRGLQFGDSVYEVIAVRHDRFVELDDHLARLWRSLEALRMASPVSEPALRIVLREIKRRNHVQDGLLYLQITRGIAPRNHKFPDRTVRSTLIVTGAQRTSTDQLMALREGVTVVTLEDARWRHCDIKSTNLLPNVLAKQTAIDAGAREAWLVDEEGFITEGTSSTAWIVLENGHVVTRPLSTRILPGVTRLNLLAVLKQMQIECVERPFTVQEAEFAKEAFLTSANNPVTPVVTINGVVIGDGTPGQVTRLLQSAYQTGNGAS